MGLVLFGVEMYLGFIAEFLIGRSGLPNKCKYFHAFRSFNYLKLQPPVIDFVFNSTALGAPLP